MSIPFNRIVTFAGPYVSLIAGAAATWIIAKANALGISGLDQSDLAQQIASGVTFILAAGLTWLGQSKWLTGHQLTLVGDAQVQAAALAAPGPALAGVAGIDPEHDALMMLDEDPEADDVPLEDLPTDEEEFASPPPDVPDDEPLPDLTGRVDTP